MSKLVLTATFDATSPEQAPIIIYCGHDKCRMMLVGVWPERDDVNGQIAWYECAACKLRRGVRL